MVGLKYTGLQSFLIPVIQGVGWVSNETVEALRLQMRGLETISMTRWDGRGPDSSLRRLWILVQVQVYRVQPYGQSPNGRLIYFDIMRDIPL